MGADAFSEIIDESILVESAKKESPGSLNFRDPSWRRYAGSHLREPPTIRAALRLTEGGKFDPNAARIFQGVLSRLRCSVLLFLPSKGNVASNHRRLKQAILFAFLLVAVTGSLRLKNLVAARTMIWNHPTTTRRLNNVSR